MEDLFAEARRVVRALPLDEIRAAGVQLDRVRDNPEAARYFLAYADWAPSNPDEIFASPDPDPAGYTQVYVDLPFCPTVCNFCAFYPVIARGEQMEVYVTSLQREIRLIADVYFSRGYEAGALELGGGTPTHLPPDLLAVVVNALTRSLPFRAGAERNCETTPEEILGQVGAERLRILRDAGFDRISIGAQSFSDKVLKAAKRSHGSEEITRALDAARAVGFRRVNFDILVGLLDQTVEDFLASIERSIELDIDIIEIYAMRYFDTKQPVPLTKRYLDQPQRFITADDLLLARVAADILLRDAGYLSDNGRTYCKPDMEGGYYAEYYKHNFAGANVIGLGRKSHSNVYPWQYANYRNIDKYTAALNTNRLPIAAGHRLSRCGLLAKRLTGAMQLPDPILFGAICADFSRDEVAPFEELFSNFVTCGLLEPIPGAYRKTFAGWLFIEEMLKRIFDAAVSPFNASVAFLGRGQRQLEQKVGTTTK